MGDEFEPYTNEKVNTEFCAWEFKGAENDVIVDVSVDEEVIDETLQAREQAIADGYAEGMKLAQDEINAQKATLAHWIETLKKPVELLDDQLIQELIQTLSWLSAHCIGVELSADPNKLHALFLEIKAELPSLKGDKVFAMNPDDVAWIKSEFNEQFIPGLHQILVEDPSLNRGDFYLRGDHSDLDGRIHTRFLTLFAQYINEDHLKTSSELQAEE